MKELLQPLCDAFGPAGFEDEVRELIREWIEPHCDEVRIDTMGNLVGLRRGNGKGRRIMLAAHMDEIGLIITQVEDSGLLRFSQIGVVPLKTLLGMRVRFANGTLGVISLEGGAEVEILSRELPDMGKWFVDVGAREREGLPVGVGDVATLFRPFADLGERVVAGGLDDRAGCAVLVETLRRLESSPHDIYFAFTVQEEVGSRGATTAAYMIEPDIGIAVDVTSTGDTPRPKQPMAVRLGAGPAIKVADRGLISHPRVREALVQAAEAEQIPYQLEVLPLGSTDAQAMQRARGGVLAGAVSVPCRYIHTPGEMIDMHDLEGAVRLLTAFLARPWPA
ncbi:MAG: M42 family peptidase [Caldilineae bacterium]|nr:MAG: M42 family peptidase [Caldilineae bacterium]